MADDKPTLASPWLAHALRAVSQHYPTMRGTGVAAPALESLRRRFEGGPGAAGEWVHVAATEAHPAMVFDLAHRYQRKLFYFTRCYARLYVDQRVRVLLASRVPPGGVFVDVGANIGFITLTAGAISSGSVRVIAFEPDPASFRSLSLGARASGCKNVECFQLALGDKTTPEALLHVARDGTASSLIAEAPGREDRYSGSARCEVDTLDHLVACGRLALPRIDLVKIDVEGFEVAAVAGMLGTLRATTLPPLYIEVRGPEGSTRAPGTYARVVRELAPLGYRPFRVRADGTTRAVGGDEVRGREDILFEASRD